MAAVTVEVGADRITVVYSVARAMRFGVAATLPIQGQTWAQRAAEQSAPPTRAEAWYVYYGPAETPIWSDRCATLPASADIWCQTLLTDPGLLVTFAQAVPVRAGRIYWHYQNEPAAKVKAGTLTLADYRTRTAQVHAAIPAGHPSLIPSQELQELDLRTGGVDMRPYILPTTKHLGWSVYDIYAKLDPVVQIGRIAAFMAQYPALTWGVAAAGRPLALTASTDDRTARASWLELSYLAARREGATEYLWFDRLGSDGRDYRLDGPTLSALDRLRTV